MPKWTYSIAIINDTDRPLELVSSNVPWGNCEHEFSKIISPNRTGEFRVYSPAGAPYGLEFYFSMRSVPEDGEKSYGFCHFSVDMPYWKHKNTSHFACEGILASSGFIPVPDGAHDFATTVHIYTKLSEDDASETLVGEKLNTREPGNYSNLYSWDKVNELKVIDADETPIKNFMPENNILESRKTIARTEITSVPKKFWSQIKDAKYSDEYSKTFVKDYFTVLVYELRRNKTISIAAKQSFSEEVEISNRSTVRRETNTDFLIENTIEMNASNKAIDLSENLRMQYEISRLDEYCEESQKTIKRTVEYAAVDYDRDIVLWSIVEVLELYRINKYGKVELVAIGDYYLTDTQRTYSVGCKEAETLYEREGTDSDYIYYSENAVVVLNGEMLKDKKVGSDAKGSINVDGITYQWREVHTTNAQRGIMIKNGGKSHVYDIVGDPHQDRHYREDARKWYEKLVTKVVRLINKGNAKWEGPIDVEINGRNYKLKK